MRNIEKWFALLSAAFDIVELLRSMIVNRGPQHRNIGAKAVLLDYYKFVSINFS